MRCIADRQHAEVAWRSGRPDKGGVGYMFWYTRKIRTFEIMGKRIMRRMVAKYIYIIDEDVE